MCCGRIGGKRIVGVGGVIVLRLLGGGRRWLDGLLQPHLRPKQGARYARMLAQMALLRGLIT